MGYCMTTVCPLPCLLLVAGFWHLLAIQPAFPVQRADCLARTKAASVRQRTHRHYCYFCKDSKSGVTLKPKALLRAPAQMGFAKLLLPGGASGSVDCACISRNCPLRAPCVRARLVRYGVQPCPPLLDRRRRRRLRLRGPRSVLSLPRSFSPTAE